MRQIAYFSMEIALKPEMKTYSGGLGILAGDLLFAAADLEIPIVGISLLNRKGYLHQNLDLNGKQSEESEPWDVEGYLSRQSQKIEFTLNNHSVSCIAWKYEITGVNGYKVPVYFLDTDIAENTEWDRKLTDYLYGGDAYHGMLISTSSHPKLLASFKSFFLVTGTSTHRGKGFCYHTGIFIPFPVNKFINRCEMTVQILTIVSRLILFNINEKGSLKRCLSGRVYL